MVLLTKAYLKYVVQEETEASVTYRAVKIKEDEIVVTPTEWTDKVTVTITTTESLCTIQYKIGEDGEWTDYTEGGFEVNENTTVYARLVYKNPGYADQIMPETSKVISNIDDIAPQVSLSQTRLADVVEIGDYVAYDATSGGEYTYTTDSTLTGSTAQSTFSSSDEMKWRVLSVDKETGIVELMSADPTESKLYLYGSTGYTNSEDVLNDIGAVYGHGTGAISGRSINIDDIDQYSTFSVRDHINNSTTTKEYTSGTFINEDGIIINASEENPITMKQTHYAYTAEKYIEDSDICKMFTVNLEDDSYKNYWINMKQYNISSGNYVVSRSYNGWISGCGLFNIERGNLYLVGHTVVPVVTLQTNIQTTGQDETGAWIIQGERTIKGTATDEQTGVVAYQYSTDGTLTKDSEGWTEIEKTANLEAPEYEIGDYGKYYFYAKDAVGNMSKAEIEAGKLVASTKVGENITYHTSLQDAIDEAGTSEATVMLLESVTERVTIATGQNITFDMNGNILTNENARIIINFGTLTIKDSLKAGKIYSKSSGAYIDNASTGTLNIESGKIEIDDLSNIAVVNAGILNVKGGSITSGKKHSGIQNSYKLNISGGKIEGYRAIYNYSTVDIVITGGRLTGLVDYAIYRGSGTVSVRIGEKDGKVSTEIPVITGVSSGVKIDESITLNFYDGIIKGKTSAINGTVADVEEGYEIVNGTETIDGVEYQTAYLALKQYTITYDYNYGSKTAEETKNHFDTLADLPIIGRSGYTFLGWYTDPEGGEQITGEEIVTQDATYYAHWEEVQYTIEYDLSEGILDVENPSTYNVNSESITLNNPTKDTYTFTGWTEEINNLEWNKGFVNISDGSLSKEESAWPGAYYTDMIYLEAGKTYTLSGYGEYSGFKWRGYNTSGGYLGNLSETNQYTTTEDCYVRILYYQTSTVAQRTGTVITASSQDVTEIIPKGSTGNRKYTANFELNKYTVTYNYNIPNYSYSLRDEVILTNFNGGTNYYSANISKIYISDLEEGDVLNISYDISYEDLTGDSNYHMTLQGCGITGWDKGQLPRKLITPIGTGNEKIEYRVTLTTDMLKNTAWTTALRTDYYTGGTVKITNVKAIKEKLENVEVRHGSSLETLPVPTEAGYTFLGWYTDPEEGEQITSDSVITQDIEYYAHWQANDPVTVTYEYNGAEGGNSAASATVLQGQSVSLPTPTKTDCEIEGWYADETCTNKVGNAGDKYTVTEDQTLYAYWNDAITYDLAGGTLETENPTSYNENTEDITLNNPTKPGYTFVGWTGTDLTEPTKTVVIPKGSTGARSYTAVWEAKELTITYEYNGAEGGNSETSSTVLGGQSVVLPTPTKTGYIFEGWYSDETYTTKVGDAGGTYEVTSDVTLYAKWKELNVGDTITYNPSGTYNWDATYATANTTGITTLSSESGESYNITTWKILSVDKNTGEIQIVPTAPTTGTVTLQGAQGYNNAVYLLNEACSELYSDSSKGITARSITEEDFVEAGGTTWTDYRASYNTGTVTYGNQYTSAYTTYRYYPSIYAQEKNSVIDGTTSVEGYSQSEQTSLIGSTDNNATNGYLKAGTSIQPYQTSYNTSNYSTTVGLLGDTYAGLLLPKGSSTTYWVASRSVLLNSNNCNFYVCSVYVGCLGNYGVFCSNPVAYSNSRALFPVVSLNSELLETTETDGVYNVK